jgi:acyl-CoA synthetase (AMP-forming)/AMP-acid ligase II
VTHSNCAVTVTKAGTVGRPLPGVEVRLVDEEDRDVAPGAPGEIICRGENITMATGGSRRRLLRPYAMAGSARVISP